jgi:hypothetical protein
MDEYTIRETVTLDPALLQAYPHLRTWAGRSVSEPSSTGRFDLANGFHGHLVTPAGSIYINPVPGGGNYYLCFFKHHAAPVKQPFEFKADSVMHRE